MTELDELGESDMHLNSATSKDVSIEQPHLELKPDPPHTMHEAELNDDAEQATHVTIQLPDGMQGTTLSQQKLQELILQLSQSGQIELREDSKIVIDLKFSGKSEEHATEKDVHNLSSMAENTPEQSLPSIRAKPVQAKTPSIKMDEIRSTVNTPIARQNQRQQIQQPTYILVPGGQLPNSTNQFQAPASLRTMSSGSTVLRSISGTNASGTSGFNSSDRSFIVLQQPFSSTTGVTPASSVPMMVGNNTSNVLPIRQLTSGVGRVAANTTWVAATPNRMTTQSCSSELYMNSLNVLSTGSQIKRDTFPRESSWQQYVKQFTKLGPCPICGDKISGYHYGIFCCESCKGFFKRTVQNAKRYACHHPNTSSVCEITVASRKKCPACRFLKCVDKGMRIEAIRSDRTRGGRSMYPGSRYLRQIASRVNTVRSSGFDSTMGDLDTTGRSSSMDQDQLALLGLSTHHTLGPDGLPSSMDAGGGVYLDPAVLGTSMDDDEETDMLRVNQSLSEYPNAVQSVSASNAAFINRQVKIAGVGDGVNKPQVEFSKELNDLLIVEESIEGEPEDVLEIDTEGPPPGMFVPEGVSEDEAAVYRALLKLTDQRLYRTVRWSRALPEFAQLDTDDQILLLQNCWTDLLCLDCCWRSLPTPKEIRLTSTKCINLEAARELGAEDVVERMLQLTQFLTELPLDMVEYASLKAIILMRSDLKSLKASTHVREYQEAVRRSLSDYMLKAYPTKHDKYTKLLSCISDLQATSQTARVMLVDLDLTPYLSTNSLLMELLRSDVQRYAPVGITSGAPMEADESVVGGDGGELEKIDPKTSLNSNLTEPVVEPAIEDSSEQRFDSTNDKEEFIQSASDDCSNGKLATHESAVLNESTDLQP